MRDTQQKNERINKSIRDQEKSVQYLKVLVILVACILIQLMFDLY